MSSDFELEVDSEPEFNQSTVSEHDKAESRKTQEGGKSNSIDMKKENNRSSSSNTKEEEKENETEKANSKQDEPCNHFRLDPTASFGTCKCGHPRTAHGKQESNKAAELLTNLKAKNSSANIDEDLGGKQDTPCGRFRLDPVATTFGMCKCGHKKADHGPSKVNKAQKALEELKKGNESKYKGAARQSIQPCDKYIVDTKADEFGLCLCGFKKEDHLEKDENVASKLLRNLKEKNAKKNEMEDMEAAGFSEQPLPSETEDDVDQLTKQESKAAENNAQVVSPEQSKKSGCGCTIC